MDMGQSSGKLSSIAHQLMFNYDIDYDNPLGKGTTATVFTATNKRTGKKLAAKRLSKNQPKGLSDSDWESELSLRKEENELWPKLVHPNIARFRQIVDDGDDPYYWIFSDYYAGGDISGILRQFDSGVPECIIYMIFRQFMEAIRYMHLNNVAHRDIKLENMVLDNYLQMNVAVIDFGTGFIVRENKPTTIKNVGTLGSAVYMAPDFRGSQDKVLKLDAIDIWACGISLYRLLENKIIYNYIDKNTYKDFLVFTRDIPLLEDLIKNMLLIDPNTRLTAVDVLNHPWMKWWDNRFKHNRTCYRLPPKPQLLRPDGISDPSGIARNPSLPWSANIWELDIDKRGIDMEYLSKDDRAKYTKRIRRLRDLRKIKHVSWDEDIRSLLHTFDEHVSMEVNTPPEAIKSSPSTEHVSMQVSTPLEVLDFIKYEEPKSSPFLPVSHPYIHNPTYNNSFKFVTQHGIHAQIYHDDLNIHWTEHGDVPNPNYYRF